MIDTTLTTAVRKFANVQYEKSRSKLKKVRGIIHQARKKFEDNINAEINSDNSKISFKGKITLQSLINGWLNSIIAGQSIDFYDYAGQIISYVKALKNFKLTTIKKTELAEDMKDYILNNDEWLQSIELDDIVNLSIQQDRAKAIGNIVEPIYSQFLQKHFKPYTTNLIIENIDNACQRLQSADALMKIKDTGVGISFKTGTKLVDRKMYEAFTVTRTGQLDQMAEAKEVVKAMQTDQLQTKDADLIANGLAWHYILQGLFGNLIATEDSLTIDNFIINTNTRRTPGMYPLYFMSQNHFMSMGAIINQILHIGKEGMYPDNINRNYTHFNFYKTSIQNHARQLAMTVEDVDSLKALKEKIKQSDISQLLKDNRDFRQKLIYLLRIYSTSSEINIETLKGSTDGSVRSNWYNNNALANAYELLLQYFEKQIESTKQYDYHFAISYQIALTNLGAVNE